MKIIQLGLENFLSYKEKTVINPLQDVTVFVGPNNSGKSNVVKAFQFLRGLAGSKWEIPFGEIIFDKTRKNFNM